MVIGTAAEQPSRYPCHKGLFTRGASAVPLLAAQYEFSVHDPVVFPDGPRTVSGSPSDTTCAARPHTPCSACCSPPQPPIRRELSHQDAHAPNCTADAADHRDVTFGILALQAAAVRVHQRFPLHSWQFRSGGVAAEPESPESEPMVRAE